MLDLHILRQGAATFTVMLSDEQLQCCATLLCELNDWNQHLNLTAIRDPQQQLIKHLLDSFSVQPYLRGSRIADVGTGAGFPGLPLALVNPDKHFTLIDSINKKLRFVQHAAQAMGINNVTVVHTRAEQYKPEVPFDCVIARALSSVENIVEWSGHLCAAGGKLLAMKGRFPEEELKSIPKQWQVLGIHALHVPGLEEQRHLVELSRVPAGSRS